MTCALQVASLVVFLLVGHWRVMLDIADLMRDVNQRTENTVGDGHTHAQGRMSSAVLRGTRPTLILAGALLCWPKNQE